MENIISILNTIINGVKNPIMSAVGAVSTLFMWIFIKVQLGNFREQAAEQHKEEAKAENNDTLENQHAKADSSIRDRLKRTP